MQQRTLQQGDVVQIAPTLDTPFAGCFLIVTEPRGDGAKGYVRVLAPYGKRDGPHLAFFQCRWEDMEYVGCCVWDLRTRPRAAR
jgi:hypothetical protein